MTEPFIVTDTVHNVLIWKEKKLVKKRSGMKTSSGSEL